MIDGVNSSETSQAQLQERRSVASKVLTPQELVAVSNAIEKSWSDDPRFKEKMEYESQQALILVRAIKNGEISEEQATNIIASGKTELSMITETDPLTEIPNRPGIERYIKEQIMLAKISGKPISIAFVDLDRFKDINDRYSHEAGDAVLQAVGGYLKSGLKRTNDRAGRWGGEEFVIVMPETNEEGASTLLNIFRDNMNESVTEAVISVCDYTFDRPITASFGLTSSVISPDDNRSTDDICTDLINSADKRVLLAKNNGRNRVVSSVEEKDLVS